MVRGFPVPLGCDPFAHEVKELCLFLLGPSCLLGLTLGMHHLFKLSAFLGHADVFRSRLLVLALFAGFGTKRPAVQ